MTAVADVGDAVELTFTTAPGATVTVTWLDPYQNAVEDNVEVDEDPVGSGKFVRTLTVTSAGMWTAVFTASGAAQAVERYYIRATAVSGPPPLAAVGDVRAQFGTMTAAQESLAGWLLRAASTMVRSRFPLVDQDIAAGRLDRDMAALAVTNMVLRVLRNPNGLRSETTGPFSRSWDTTVAAGLLVLTGDDIAILTPAEVIPDDVAALGIGTIRVVPGMAPPVRPYWKRRAGPHAGH